MTQAATSFAFGANQGKTRKPRKVSAEGRARMAAAQKKRWAAQKKASKKVVMWIAGGRCQAAFSTVSLYCSIDGKALIRFPRSAHFADVVPSSSTRLRPCRLPFP